MDHENELEPEKYMSYTIKVEENLYKKIDNHLRLLKHIDNHNHSKQRWFLEAVEDKLQRDKKVSVENLPKARHLKLKMDRRLNEELEKRTNLIKKFRSSYSKKLWILEAICEKLDHEEELVNELLQKVASSSPTDHTSC